MNGFAFPALRRVSALAVLAAMLLALLAGCGQPSPQTPTSGTPSSPAGTTEAAATEPPATAPADGDPGNVTCKGSYTASEDQVQSLSGQTVAFLERAPEPTEEGSEETVPETLAALEETEPMETVPVETGDSAEPAEETEPQPEPYVPLPELTAGQLQVWYHMAIADYRQAGHEENPDYTQPLDVQQFQREGSAAITWQQYFLETALKSWHTAMALVMQGHEEGLPTEEAYQPNLPFHEIYLKDIPAVKVLYGYSTPYTPNLLHQEYLDSLPALLADLAVRQGFSSADALAEAAAGVDSQALAEYGELLNRAYMYFTNLSYFLTPSQEEVTAYCEEQGIAREGGSLVTLRSLLLVPEGDTEEDRAACEAAAQQMLDTFLKQRDHSEPRFAELAHDNSQDTGSALTGGLYQDLAQGQLAGSLDAWAFDPARQAGDTTVLTSEAGVHILYFVEAVPGWYVQGEQALIRALSQELAAQAREKYPITLDYSAMALGTSGESGLTSPDLLYPDVAHERYPVAQLYLQQDYPTTKYGAFNLSGHGCGITTMAMLATYLSDEEHTPPEMAAEYPEYCFRSGTDGRLFVNAPAELGFFLKKQVYNYQEVDAAMAEGHVAVVVQHKGYWTRGGHYLLLEALTEEGEVQVRDSNMFNYGRLHPHKKDSFKWGTITAAGMSYWIYDKKIVRIPACARCGDAAGEGAISQTMLREDYICHKCTPAMARRENFLDLIG